MKAAEKGASGVFDRLVSELSVQERQDFLARLRFSRDVGETLLREPEPTPESRFDRVFQELSLFERILLFLRTILTGKDRVSLVREFTLKRVARAVGSGAGEYFNPRTMELLDPFFRQIASLRDAGEFFRKPVREALGVHKKDFVAFLAGLDLPVVQEHLLSESDPANHGQIITELSEFEMKRSLDSSLRDAFEEIGEDDRQLMYRGVQLLHWLQGLTNFGFDRFLNRFSPPGTCPANTLLVPLKELAAVLQRLTVPPSTQLVSSIFLFALREELSGKDFDLEGSLDRVIAQAKEALSAIRRFNACVPINDIIRLIVNDSDWIPALKGGGEDWFVLFKQFWADRLEERVSGFVVRRTRRRLLDAAAKMLRLADLPYLTNYRGRSEELRFAPAHKHSLAFLHGFLSQIFSKELNNTVKVFLLDGKFYKDDNRQELADGYHEIDQFPERIRYLDADLSNEGRRGKMLAQIMDEHNLPASGQKAATAICAAADRDAELIVLDAKKHFRSMQLVLEGILHGHGDNTYDTISNLSQIGGRENRKLLMSLRVALGHLAATNEIFGGLLDLEIEREK